jgi:hypothetical protein
VALPLLDTRRRTDGNADIDAPALAAGVTR